MKENKVAMVLDLHEGYAFNTNHKSVGNILPGTPMTKYFPWPWTR